MQERMGKGRLVRFSLVCCLLLITTRLFAQSELTLESYLEQVRKFSPTLAAKMAMGEAAVASESAVDSQLAPAVNMSASQVNSKQPADPGMPQVESLSSRSLRNLSQ